MRGKEKGCKEEMKKGTGVRAEIRRKRKKRRTEGRKRS